MTAETTRAVAIVGLGLAGAALVAACASAGPGDEEGTQHPFEAILAAAHTGLTQRRREVIRDEARWARLWAEIHAGFTPAPPLPRVDFAEHMLIAVALGTRPTGGFAVKVESVTRRGQSLEIAVVEACPAAGAMVMQSLTQPVEVVRAPRLAQTPTFRERRTASCR